MRGWGGVDCEVTLPWDNSDFCGDIDKPWSLWMRDYTSEYSGHNISKIGWGWAVIVLLSSSRLKTRVLTCKGEVGGGVEGDLLLEWVVDLGFLAIHSSCPPSSTKNVDASKITTSTSGKTTKFGP